MGQKFNNYFSFIILLTSLFGFSQNEGVKPTVYPDYKGDSSYANFDKLRFDVARAQIHLLKNGALLVRLKTNANTISKLKAAGNIDLATQVEREANINNKRLMRAFLQNFTFCPVYFFNSEYSDSVKHKQLEGIFVDTNLIVNPTIVCKADFYLIAERGGIYNSSLGIVKESMANKSVETGTVFKEVFIIIKNRYFIQLHMPFPYFQKGLSKKKYGDYVETFNANLTKFYNISKEVQLTPMLKEYVY